MSRQTECVEASIKATKRAVRRHHKRRMKAKAKMIAGRIWGFVSFGIWSNDEIAAATKRADHLAACSCAMCGNPRRSTFRRAMGKTRKEIQANHDLRDDIT